MRRATIAIALALALPSAAQAQYAPFPQEEAAPGVTISGAGLARAGNEGLAARRAMRDARARASAIARAAGVQLGEATEVELQDAVGQFGPRPGPFTSAVATVTWAIVGGGQTDAVSAYGDAGVRVRPPKPRSNRSIRRTLLYARAAVTPRAAADAVRTARRAAGASGLDLGPIVSIAQPSDGGYFYDAALGAFGPGIFCKVFRRRGVAKRRCFRPRVYSLRLEATFEAR